MKSYPLRDTGFSVDLVPVAPNVFGFKLTHPDNSFLFPEASEWIANLKRAILENGDKELHLRLDKHRFKDLLAELPVLGFQLKHERTEFHSPVADLPDDQGTPISWKPMESLEEAAKALHAVAIGDPDYDPNEDALEGIKYYFGDANFKASSLQLGFIDNKLAALVIVQVKPDGWSRITYMGVHPDFRKRGLGKWVHRKGFSLMKEMGGKNYFGGTVSTNQSMLKVFRESGCRELRVLQEWIRK